MIYRYFIDPFRNPWYNNSIEVNIGLVHNHKCHPYRERYEIWIPVAVKPPKIPYRGPVRNDDSSNESDDESDIQLDDQPNDQPNDQPADQPATEPQPQHYHLRRSDFNNIWSLSRVNRQLRSELGSLFWRNIYLDNDQWEHLLLSFLRERPSVHAGIKKLRMSWNCESSESDLDYEILDFCAYISEHLELDELVFVLCTSPTIARQILRSGEELEWVRAVRTIRTRRLKVRLFLVDGDEEREGLGGLGDDWDENEEEDERYARIAAELEPKMEALLGPEVEVVEVTEQDEYLLSRGAVGRQARALQLGME
jgi:hypothetical protein